MAYERLVKKLTKENLWLYILRLLKDRPMYGYEIVKAIKEKFKFSPATVTVYVVLYRMESEGLIKKVKEEKSVGRIGRAYYAPTEKGLEVFEKGKEFIENMYRLLFS